MSEQTLRICDIKDCDRVGTHRLAVIVYGQRDDQGLHIKTERRKDGIDLCGDHERYYRSQLPLIELETEQ